MTTTKRARRRNKVIDLHAAGLRRREIAAALGITVGTVKTHLNRHRQATRPPSQYRRLREPRTIRQAQLSQCTAR